MTPVSTSPFLEIPMVVEAMEYTSRTAQTANTITERKKKKKKK